MLKNKLYKLQTLLWYYKKSFKNQMIFDIVLTIVNVFIILKNLPLSYLLLGCFALYFTSVFHMVSPVNSALACTTLKIKDMIKGNARILWIKFVISFCLALLVKIIFEKSFILMPGSYFMYIFSYALLSYAILNLLFVIGCCISKKYRSFALYLIIASFVGMCEVLHKLSFICSVTGLIALSIIILTISNLLIKKLSYETVFRREANQ